MCTAAVMADDDLPLTDDDNLNSAHNTDVTQKAGHACMLVCVFCGEEAASVAGILRVLPCLHVTCQGCLVQFLSDTSSPHKDADFAALIFSCPRCSYAVQLPHEGVAGLKDATFLQSANSADVVSNVERMRDGEANSTEQEQDINCGSDGVNGASVSMSGNLPQSMMGTNLSEDVSSVPKNGGSGDRGMEQYAAVSVNGAGSDLQIQDDTVTRSQIRSLSQDAHSRQCSCQQTSLQIKLAAQDLEARKIALRANITRRADHLCDLIRARRDHLLEELDREQSQSSAEYDRRVEVLDVYSRSVEDSCRFAGAVLAADDVPVGLETDVASRLNQLILSDTEAADSRGNMTEFSAVRLDVPDTQHEESHLEKLFGSLTRGTVGNVNRVRSFNTDLRWPTGFAVTRGHGSVLAGKAGAFADEGQVLFYDGHGSCVRRHTLPAGHLPIDVIAVGSGRVLVSDVSGRVTKFSVSGRLVDEWKDVFRGPSGHMAVSSGTEVLVTSAGEGCIHRYSETGGCRFATFSLQWPDIAPDITTTPDITAITVNSHNEIIVTASNLPSPHFFAADGQFLHSSLKQTAAVKQHCAENGQISTSVALPSAMCCDLFDNVLIADFLDNCVHLVSRSGLHLGRLLTKTHGIACPNFISLDQDGRLYVGQYGGDVLVFHYVSCVKHV